MILYVLLGLLLAVTLLILLAIARTNQLLLEANAQRGRLSLQVGALREDVQAVIAEVSSLQPPMSEALEWLQQIHVAVEELQPCPES